LEGDVKNYVFTVLVVLGNMTISMIPTTTFAHGYGHGYVNVQDHIITMGESYFKVDDGEENATLTLEAGKMYMLVLKNEGKFRHEIRFGRDLLHDEQIYNEDLIGHGTESRGAHGSFSVMLRPGESSTLSLVIPTDRIGEWEFACFMPGHYSFGQHAKLIVIPPSKNDEELW
jgi:uncharacterized cupredoxin-like copper-binding protein